jgi:hypothetical protein
VTGRRLDRSTETWLGVACYVAGSWFLYQAFDRRGRAKPWAMKWLPGA